MQKAEYEIIVEKGMQYPKEINIPLKSFKETRDIQEVALLTQSGNWIVYLVNRCTDGGVLFRLGEVCD